MKIEYKQGSHNAVADALSCMDDVCVEILTLSIVEWGDLIRAAYQRNHEQMQRVKPPVNKKEQFDYLIDNVLHGQSQFGYEVKQGIVYRDGKICIPNDSEVRLKIFNDCHDAKVSGHLGASRTVARIQANYFWPRIVKDVRIYIASCDSCQRNKKSTQKPIGLMQPLPVPERPFERLGIDFVGPWKTTARGNNVILVVTDGLSKLVKLIPTVDTITAKETARLLFTHVFTWTGIPREILSDRDARFISSFWTQIHKMLDVKIAMSTAYHHQANGQTERVNRTMEEILRHYVSHRHDNWDELLPTVEFAYNSSKHSTTQKTPFEVIFGFNHQTNVAGAIAGHGDATDYVEQLKRNIDEARKAIIDAQSPAKSAYDAKRRDIQFVVGQLVMLRTKNYLDANERLRPTRKLRSPFIGPYAIKAIEGLNITLEIPKSMKINPIVHVEQVKPYISDNQPGRYKPKPSKVIINGEDEYEVQEIIDHRTTKKGDEYLVHWKGYNRNEADWQPAANLEHSQKLIRAFWQAQGH